MRTLILTTILALSTPAMAVDCALTTKVADASKLLDGAEGSYGDLDVDGFNEAVDELSLALQCLNEPMPTDVAAHVHRMQALRDFIAGEDSDAQESLRAAKVLDPDYDFPDSLLPGNHPLRSEYSRMSGNAGAGKAVPPSTEGKLAFDGVVTNVRPLHATFFQVLGPDGGVAMNRYVGTRDPLPAYAGDDGPVEVYTGPSSDDPSDGLVGPVDPELGDDDKKGIPLMELSGVGIGAVGAIGMLTSYTGAKGFESDAQGATSQDDFDTHNQSYEKARGRTYIFAGVAAGGIALAAIGLAVPISDKARIELRGNGLALRVGGLR